MSNDLRAWLKLRQANVARYYPDVIAKAKEYRTLAVVTDKELNAVIGYLLAIMLNTFVLDIDEVGAARWEKMLNITPLASDTLEDRQVTILSTLMPDTPYTHRKLESILDKICGKGGHVIKANYKNYAIDIGLSLGAKRQRTVVANTLSCILPANLTLQTHLLYNRHKDLKRFTHGRMRDLSLTHFALREEALPDA